MGFFSKLFAKDPAAEAAADPFMPGKVVVVGGFGTGRITSIEPIRDVECFVVRMDMLPPKTSNLYVSTDGNGFPMRVPVNAEDAQQQLAFLVPKHEPAEWADLAESFAEIRQRSRTVVDMRKLLEHMYPSVQLDRIEQRKMLEWAEDALFSELAVALGRTREELRAEVRTRFSLPAVAPRKNHSPGPLPETPLVAGLAPIGSFAVQQQLVICDPLVVADREQQLKLIAAGEIPAGELGEEQLPILQTLNGKKGTWHAYVRRTKPEEALALVVAHASVGVHPTALREVGVIAPESEFLGAFDRPVIDDPDFVGEEIEFSHESFPRITEGRGVAVDRLVPEAFRVLVAEEGGEIVYVEVPFDAEPEKAPAD